MRRTVCAIATLLVFSSGTAVAAYLKLGPEGVADESNCGVVFSITNRTNRNIDRIFGWVYGYQSKAPYSFTLVSAQNTPSIRISPGPHRPGQTALYWFSVPAYYFPMKKFGLVVYDASVSFDR